MATIASRYRGDLAAQLSKSRQNQTDGKRELYFCTATITQEMVDIIQRELAATDRTGSRISRMRLFFCKGLIEPLFSADVLENMEKVTIFGTDDEFSSVLEALGEGLYGNHSLCHLEVGVPPGTGSAYADAWSKFASGLSACSTLKHFQLCSRLANNLPAPCVEPVLRSIAALGAIQNLILQYCDLSKRCMEHIDSLCLSSKTLEMLCMLNCIMDGYDAVSFVQQLPFATETLKVLRMDNSVFTGDGAKLLSKAFSDALADDEHRLGMSSIVKFDVFLTKPQINIEHKDFYLVLNKIGQFRGFNQDSMGPTRWLETLLRLQQDRLSHDNEFHCRYDLSFVYYYLRYKPTCWCQ